MTTPHSGRYCQTRFEYWEFGRLVASVVHCSNCRKMPPSHLTQPPPPKLSLKKGCRTSSEQFSCWTSKQYNASYKNLQLPRTYLLATICLFVCFPHTDSLPKKKGLITRKKKRRWHGLLSKNFGGGLKDETLFSFFSP